MDMLATINSETLCSIACKHKTYGSGTVTKIRCSENQGKPELFLTFESEAKNTTFAYTIASKFLEFDETDALTIENLLAEYLDNWLAFDNERKAEEQAKREARQAELEAAKKAKEDEKKAEAFERKKAKDIKDFEAMTQVARPLSAASEFYISLGWLTKHTGTVSAALPDYLESAFRKHFGEAPCRVVDSKKKGPAGWTSQWATSFQLSLKKPDIIPASLEEYLNPARKALTDTDFIWDLVDNYGFKFGKTQDLEAIKSCIPATYLSDFELGLAM